MPFSASTFFNSSTIRSLNLSIPSASDSTTRISENLSITIPGRKSASPNISLHDDISTVCFLYSTQSLTLCSKKASSIWLVWRLNILTVILDLRLIKPIPMKYPSKSFTFTSPPSSTSPVILSISLSYTHIPPDFNVLPSPFLIFTIPCILYKSCIFILFSNVIYLCLLFYDRQLYILLLNLISWTIHLTPISKLTIIPLIV